MSRCHNLSMQSGGHLILTAAGAHAGAQIWSQLLAGISNSWMRFSAAPHQSVLTQRRSNNGSQNWSVWEESRPSKHPRGLWVRRNMCKVKEAYVNIYVPLAPPSAAGCCPRVWPRSPSLSSLALHHNPLFTLNAYSEHTGVVLFTLQAEPSLQKPFLHQHPSYPRDGWWCCWFDTPGTLFYPKISVMSFIWT